MNVIYMSPDFPPQYHQFCLHLKAAGANVLGIADAPYDQLAPEVRQALTEYYRVDDMHDYDQLVRACGYFTHRYGKLGRLDSLNEYWLETEARLRDDFNIFGIRSDAIGHIRRKSLMKEKFRAAGAAVADGRVVHTPAEARALIAETGYPVVAKPDAGVGALNTYRLDNDRDLAAFFQNKPPVPYIVEAFVRGDICSFDGLADRDGRLVFHTSHLFSQGIMETVNEARHVSYYSLRELPPALEALGRRCVQSFDVRERFFHIEFFQTGPEQYVGLEVNMRPPGGYTTDMFNYACDIDIYRAWARLLALGDADLKYTRKYHCCYASRKQQLNYRHGHEEILARYGDRIVQVVRVPGVFSSALGDIGYIFRSPDMDVVEEVTTFIHRLK
ncbi:MAG: carboxylate--amine ligase [Desulfobacterales bacterium]|nr:carboxylate--amine ligase [Desulfobacterales bacterium]